MAERNKQQNQKNAKYVKFTVRGLELTRLKRKAHEYLIEQPNATWDAFQTHITSKDVIYTISSEPVPNATSDQNTKLHSLEQQTKELTALFKEQQVNQVIQSNPRPVNADNKSRQNMARFCSFCPRNAHTLMNCRTKALDDQIRRQQKRNNRERRTVFTHDYNERRGPNVLIGNPDTEIRTTRHFTDRPASTQIGTEIQTQIDHTTKKDQVTPGTTVQITVN